MGPRRRGSAGPDGRLTIAETEPAAAVQGAALQSKALLPVISRAAETYDGVLNDIKGQHVSERHVRDVIDGARGGRVAEGKVGGGTGMICSEFKGGTASRSRTWTHMSPAKCGLRRA